MAERPLKWSGGGDLIPAPKIKFQPQRVRQGYVLRNASLGDFVVVRTSYSVLKQPYIV